MTKTNTNFSYIELNQVSLSLEGPEGKINILHDVNLSLGQGEFACLVGPSGAGKTSLLMLIAGLETPTSGEILIDGNAIQDLSEEELTVFRANNVGIVFQHFHLVPTMTAQENVMLPLEFLGKEPLSSIKEKAATMLNKVGLGERKSHFPNQLSGGEQQRVALARAFINNPKLLLADEPTGNLDEDNSKRILELIKELQQEAGTTVLFITHDHDIAQSADAVIELQHGVVEA